MTFVLTFALHAALHALEGEGVLIRAVGLGESSDIVHALEEVGDLGFGSRRVTCAAIGRQASRIELLHLSFAQRAVLETVYQRLKPTFCEQCIII